jgi:hypothetical protein
MLSVANKPFILDAIMLIVVILSVVAQHNGTQQNCKKRSDEYAYAVAL